MDSVFPPHEVPSDWYGLGPSCGQCQVRIPEEYNSKIYMGDRERECLLTSKEDDISLK